MNMEEKDFIKKATYPGGNKALSKFITQNLIYPKEALEKRIEGTVLVQFKVNANGTVFNTKIAKGIGYGCDEEAMRIVNKLEYAKVINRKLKITTSKKIKIKFKLPNSKNKIIINYEIVK